MTAIHRSDIAIPRSETNWGYSEILGVLALYTFLVFKVVSSIFSPAQTAITSISDSQSAAEEIFTSQHSNAPIELPNTPTQLHASASVDASAVAIPSAPIIPEISYNQAFQEPLGSDPDSCLPEKTANDIGVYIYDLDEDRELASINPDVPFQFASSFKAPVLTYFLESCQQIWNPESDAWQENFLATAPENRSNWYLSDEYRQRLTSQLDNVLGWQDIETFAYNNRPIVDGRVEGSMDDRYLILHQVSSMAIGSSNPSAGKVLNFVFENCLDGNYRSDSSCGGPNALTEFNAWFNDFADIQYENNESYRGLYSWDKLIERNKTGKLKEVEMPTAGLTDTCAMQAANLSCSPDLTAVNAYTSRDLFKFYYNLYHLEDEQVKEKTLDVLGAQPGENSRGYMKNLADKLDASAMSKNGRASYASNPIATDAGIFNYQEKSYVIVTMSYNNLTAMDALYGRYQENGLPADNQQGLIELMLESQLVPDGE